MWKAAVTHPSFEIVRIMWPIHTIISLASSYDPLHYDHTVIELTACRWPWLLKIRRLCFISPIVFAEALVSSLSMHFAHQSF